MDYKDLLNKKLQEDPEFAAAYAEEVELRKEEREAWVSSVEAWREEQKARQLIIAHEYVATSHDIRILETGTGIVFQTGCYYPDTGLFMPESTPLTIDNGQWYVGSATAGLTVVIPA